MMRKNLRITAATILLAFCGVNVSGQDPAAGTPVMQEQLANQKAAGKLYLKGSKELGRTDPDYRHALEQFRKATVLDPDNADPARGMGICFLNLGFPDSALQFLQRSLQQGGEQGASIHFLLARAYQLGTQPEKAIRKYNDYLNLLPGMQLVEDSARVNHLIRQAENARKLTGKEVYSYLSPVADPLNTEWNEDYAYVTPDDSLILFSSDRKEEAVKGNATEKVYCMVMTKDGRYVEDLVSKKLRRKGTDSKVIYMNSSATSMYASQAKMQWQPLAFTRRYGEWICTGVPGEWMTSAGNLRSVSVNHDSTIMVLCACPDVKDATADIYVSFRDQGEWSLPVRAGGRLNTSYDESFVCFHPVGNTLFFASDCDRSMGGYDLFSTSWDGSSWSDPVNLGYPVNSPSDELSITFTGKGGTGYITSSRPGGLGGSDIYLVTFLGENKSLIPVHIRPSALSSIESQVSLIPGLAIVEPDSRYQQLLRIHLSQPARTSLQVDVLVNDQPKPVSYKIRKGSGDIYFNLPPEREYTFFIYSEEEFSTPVHLALGDTVSPDTLGRSCTMVSILSGRSVAIPNIRFYPESSLILPESETTAKWLAGFIRSHPDCVFEIQSHIGADQVSDPGKAMEITSYRASGLTTWLVEHTGVSPGQVSGNGYGFDRAPVPGMPAERIEIRCVLMKN